MSAQPSVDESISNEESRTNICPKLIPGPPQIKYIIVNELCERFSYYGLRAILAKFLQEQLLYNENDSASISLFFSSLCYFTPLIGGYVSDSYFGKYRTIVGFSIVYCSGGIFMAAAAGTLSTAMTFIGLALIGIGTGGIKPCVSTFGADQFPKSSGANSVAQDRELERYFMAFYFSINFGSIGSFLIIPLVREHFGYVWAFLIPAVCLLLALCVFLSATAKYNRVPPEGSVFKVIYGVLSAARKPTPLLLESRMESEWDVSQVREVPVLNSGGNSAEALDTAQVDPESPSYGSQTEIKPLMGKAKYLDRAIGKYSKQTVEDVRGVWELVPIFLCFPCFWALFDQQGNTWEQQAEDMDTWIFQPDQMAFWNPLLIMILIPFFDKIIYPFWRKHHPSVNALHKMALGMVFSVASYIVSAFVQISVQRSPGKVSVFWQLPQYILISLGEILISVTGLDFAYSQAPISMKAFIASFNLSMVAIGDLCAGVIYTSVSGMDRHNVFFLFSGLMFVNLIVFAFFAKRYRFKRYSDKPQEGTDIQMEQNMVSKRISRKDNAEHSYLATGSVESAGLESVNEPDVVRRRGTGKQGAYSRMDD